MGSASPAGIITLDSATTYTVTWYSVDTAYYNTAGSVTGIIYAVGADGSTLLSPYLSFTRPYLAPCTSFNPMQSTFALTQPSSYELSTTAQTVTFTGFYPTTELCVSGYALTSSSAVLTLPTATV